MGADCSHGMPTPASCWDCMIAGALDVPPREPERVLVILTARYPGLCDSCSRSIEEGDVIAKTDRERWVHKECIDA